MSPRALSTPLAYPEAATGSATVVLEFTIDPTGAVVDARALSGESPFREAALEAVKAWQFVPAERGGKPVRARVRYSVQFTPPEPAPEPPPSAAPRSDSDAAPRARPAPKRPKTESAPIEVVVEGERAPSGSVLLTREETRSLPGTFGDPLRAIEAQPGVVPIVSGLPAFFIRGAPPANVGFFFDGVELPLLYHAFFGPSVVHPGFIDAIEFYPGSAPAEYGRFAGPIVAVTSRPLSCRAAGEVSLRLIDAGALVQSGPWSGQSTPDAPACNSGVRAAGRYSYAGLVLSLLSDAQLDYWDYQVQASTLLGAKDTLSVVSFGGYDLFRPPQTSVNSGAELSFHRFDLRWDRRVTPNSDLRLALTGGYDRASGADAPSSIVTDHSLRLRTEYKRRFGPSASLRAGFDTRLDRFGLDADRRSLNYPDFSRLFPARVEGVGGGYLSFALEPERGVRVAPGLRADVYSSQGTTVVGVDPRVSAEFDVSRSLRLQHSLGIAHQRPNFAAQVPGAQVADLENGLQWALLWSSGLRLVLPWDLTATATVFRSAYFHALDPLGGGRDFTIDRTSLDRRATVSAAGLELHVSRPVTKRLGGFVSYTLSRSEQSSRDQKSPSGFDRTHILQTALSYDLGRAWRIGARAVVYSGVPELNLQGTPHFTGSRRGSPFFRLDLRAEKRFRIGETGYWGLIAEVLNATSTKETVRLDCGEVCRERTAGPVVLPSVGIEAGF
ncbi:MAG TPA: TonB family protein [Polyangiaceae bacterium]|nr:TonB family protein [Polyangiaceae bacterium]